MHPLIRRGALAALLSSVVLASPTPAAAQRRADWDPRAAHVTRAELQELMQRLELTVQSPAYSYRLHDRARRELRLLQNRLVEGDFRVGDRVAMRVVAETALTDTFVVRPGPVLTLPDVGDVSIRGVLRAELDSHLTTELSRFLRQPQVRTQPLLRVFVGGAVGNPGLYTLPSSTLLADALGAAGGPTGTARLDDISVDRGGERVWTGDLLVDAVVEGRTLDQLSLRDGDRIDVGQQGGGRFGWLSGATSTLRSISLLLALPFSILALGRLL